MNITVLGNGSWATALVKIISENQHHVHWWMRNPLAIEHIKTRNHNPDYLSSVEFNPKFIHPESNLETCVLKSDLILIGVPSAFVADVIQGIDINLLSHKIILSAIKGIIPGEQLFLEEYLIKLGCKDFDYQFISGPCHAEEVAQEKLSYLTVAGNTKNTVEKTCLLLQSSYINTIISNDIEGSQLSSVLKNIYALGSGIAHGLGYGDNFLSVFICNAFAEAFRYMHVKMKIDAQQIHSSVYLGDLLVTCYSLHSRNRLFGTMIGQGYSVKTAKVELGMVAEGYYASQALHLKNDNEIVKNLPIVDIIYQILWENLPPITGFKKIEKILF